MPSTTHNLHLLADELRQFGLHTGEQFAAHTPAGNRYDLCALAYLVTSDIDGIPAAFFEDEAASLALIEACVPAMAVIRAISDALPTEPCETDGVPDYIDHVSNWASTPAPLHTEPPTVREVIACVLTAATAAQTDIEGIRRVRFHGAAANHVISNPSRKPLATVCGQRVALTVNGQPHDKALPADAKVTCTACQILTQTAA